MTILADEACRKVIWTTLPVTAAISLTATKPLCRTKGAQPLQDCAPLNAKPCLPDTGLMAEPFRSLYEPILIPDDEHSERGAPLSRETAPYSGTGLQIQIQNKLEHCCGQTNHVLRGLVLFGKVTGTLTRPGKYDRISRSKPRNTGPELCQFFGRGLPDIAIRMMILKFHGLV